MNDWYRLNHRYWRATFKAGSPRFIYAVGLEAATAEAAKLGDVVDVQTLPYPSEKSPDGCPPFCWKPSQCAGRTACPQSRSCTD